MVRPHEQTGVWVTMTVSWQDPEWDLAALEVDPGARSAHWLMPRSANSVAVALDAGVDKRCESVAVGVLLRSILDV